MNLSFNQARGSKGLLCLLALAAAACSPALNWRAVASADHPVRWMMPCKPESATRRMQLPMQAAPVNVELRLQACEADGLRFSFAQLQVPTATNLSEAVRVWRLASLAAAQMAATDAQPRPWALKNAAANPSPERVLATTAQRQAQLAWFAHEGQLYQAAVYGTPKQKNLGDAAETFFSSIELP